MSKYIAFIINPISGPREVQKAKRQVPALVSELLDHEQWSPTIVTTEYSGHATVLARQYAARDYDAVVAVGGDGTVSEVAQGLLYSSTAMGIIPMGSGNGFALHLGIPTDPNRAVALLNQCQTVRVDYGLANDQLFISTCGTGFDAEVAERFAGSTRRGMLTYIRTVLHLVFTYRSQTYRLVAENKEGEQQAFDISQRAFLITFANANQWGNNAHIAPHASLQDGLMDIMILSRHALLDALPLVLRLFFGTIDRSPLVSTLRAKELTLHRQKASAFHIDGNPVNMPADVTIRLVPHGLNVLTPLQRSLLK